MALGLAYLVVLAARLPDVVRARHADADTASAPVMAALADEAPDGAQVLLGDYAWYEPFFLLDWTSALPGHRALWAVGPLAAVGVGFLAVAWAVRRAAGTRAALLALVLLATLSPLALQYLAAADIHGHTVVHACLLAAAAVALAARGARWSSRRLAAFLALVALVTAPGAASDQLLLPAGLVPFAVAGVALTLAGLPRRVAVGAVAATAAAAAGGTGLAALADRAGVTATDAVSSATFAGGERVFANARLLWETVTSLGHGTFGGRPVGFAGVLALACALTVTAAAAWLTRRATGLGPAALARTPPERVAVVAFFATSVLGLSAAFVFSTFPTDLAAARYVVGVWVGLVALAAVLLRGRAQAVLAGAAALLAFAGVVELGRGDMTAGPAYDVRGEALLLARFAREERLDHGYGGYGSAAPLTWQSNLAVRVYPVAPCGGAPGRLCPFWLHRIDSWYAPRRGARSFVVVDPRVAPAIPPPDPGVFGAPERVATVGGLQVHVFDHDVAGDLGP